MGKELGEKISDLLKQRKMKQIELAYMIGITETALSRYISGTRDPKPEVIANIATALHTTSDFLLGIENEDFDLYHIQRMIARNASEMTEQEKKELITAIFGEE